MNKTSVVDEGACLLSCPPKGTYGGDIVYWISLVDLSDEYSSAVK